MLLLAPHWAWFSLKRKIYAHRQINLSLWHSTLYESFLEHNYDIHLGVTEYLYCNTDTGCSQFTLSKMNSLTVQSILVPPSSRSSILWFFYCIDWPWRWKQYDSLKHQELHSQKYNLQPPLSMWSILLQQPWRWMLQAFPQHRWLYPSIHGMASHTKGLESPATLLWEPPTSHHDKLFRLFEECSPVPWNCVILRGITIL